MATKAPTLPSDVAEFAFVDTTAIKVHPDNVRHDIGDVTELAASIEEKGLLEPLVLVPAHDGMSEKAMGKATWLLLAGHRRLAALKVAKVRQAPAIIRGDLTTRAAQIEAMVVENQHRQDLSPVEEGEALQLLLDIDPKTTQAQLAQRTGLPKKRVSERLRLTKLSDKARGKVHAGQVSLEDAVTAASFADDPDLGPKVEAALGTASFAHQLESARQVKKFRNVFAQWCNDLRSPKSNAKEIPTEGDLPDAARRLDQLGLRGLGWIGWQSKDAQWKLLLDAHGDCEHTGFLVDDDRRDITLFCLDPTVHDVDEQEKTDEQRAAREAREADYARLAELEQRRAIAAKVRGQHVHQVLLESSEDRAKALLQTLLNRVPPMITVGYGYLPQIDRFTWPALAGFFELDVDNYKDPIDQIHGAMDSLSAVQLAAAWWFLSRAADESSLTSYAAPNDPTGERAAEYVHELSEVLDYEWSDFEIEDLGIDPLTGLRIDRTGDEDGAA